MGYTLLEKNPCSNVARLLVEFKPQANSSRRWVGLEMPVIDRRYDLCFFFFLSLFFPQMIDTMQVSGKLHFKSPVLLQFVEN